MDYLIKYLPYLGAIITYLIGTRKDWILTKIGFKKGKSEAESIHIQNSEQLMNLYNKAINDQAKWAEINLQRIEAQHKLDLEEIRQLHEQQMDEIKGKKDKELEKLRARVNDLTKEVAKLSKQLDYYKKNTGIELPKDLQ